MNNKPLVVLSSRDRFSRHDSSMAIAGPARDFLAEAIQEDFEVTTDLNFYPKEFGRNVILCGAVAAKAWLGKPSGYSGIPAWKDTGDLLKNRGYVQIARGCNVVATFSPIDCAEVFSGEEEFDDEIELDKSNSKDAAPTARGNYRFWAMADIRKLLKKERRTTYNKNDIVSLPDAAKVIDQLDWLFLDIETHPPTNTVQCLSFCGLNSAVFTVPIYDHNGKLVVSHKFLAAFTRALRRCIIVGHNISFDLSFLAHYHGIPWGPRIEDTMIQHHRVYPESEKSLAHVISYWINNSFHKDQSGTFTPRNYEQYSRLLHYNALDVLSTRAVWLAQNCDRNTTGIGPSFDSANRSVEVYLRAGLTGFEFREHFRQNRIKELEGKIKGLTRVFHVLAGSKVLPTSPQQVGNYFFRDLGLISTHKTDTGDPSTGADAMYSLLLKYPQCVSIRVLLALRDLNKQKDQLMFRAYYKEDERK